MIDDEMQILELIEGQFAALSWPDDSGGDWQAFAADFVPGAPLYPAARPVAPQTVQGFTDRLQALSKSELTQFYERLAGYRIQVYGSVAVAIAVCEMTENGQEVNRNIEALLLVKDDGRWRIAAQAWDGMKSERVEQYDRLQLIAVPQNSAQDH